MSTTHSKEFKEAIVQKILSPGGPTIMQMSEKTGITHTSIRYWIKHYGSKAPMKKSNDWTPEKKLLAIAHTMNMDEKELGTFLRTNGLHLSELEQWKQDFYNSQQSPGRPRIDREIVELRNKEKELSKDLRRKEKALAEMSARVILLKKSHAIFGDNEEDE